MYHDDFLEWIDAVDVLLCDAERIVGAVRGPAAPLADRIALSVDIIALRDRLKRERSDVSNAIRHHPFDRRP